MDLSVTYEGPRLEELLERVRRELGPDAVIVEARRRRKGGLGGFFAREWFEVVASGDDVGATAEPEPAPAPPAESDPLLSLVAAADAAERPAALDADALRLAGRRLLAASRRGFHVDSTPTGPADDEDAAALDPARAVHPAGSGRDPAGDVVDDRAGGALPIPPRVFRGEALTPLLERLDARVRPAPWPTAPAVVAVVGDLAAAKRVASALAPRFGVDADGVSVAAQTTPAGVPRWLRLDDPDTAATRAAAWRARARSAVVAVELVPGADGHAAASAVLAALGPDQVRLVVPAWRDPGELEVKAAALGGIDVVDLVELDQASDPEAFLDGGPPVGSLDGRVATPELWAATLLATRSARRG